MGAPRRHRPCKQPRLRSASLHFWRGPLLWRSPFRHACEDSGAGRRSARRPPARAAQGSFRFGYRPGCAPPVPETSRGPIDSPTRREFRLAGNRDTCRSARCPECREDGPPFRWPTPQAPASISSRAPRLMQPLAFGGHHPAHARRLGRVCRLASPSACAALLRRHRSGYRLAPLLPSRDFARADKIISS